MKKFADVILPLPLYSYFTYSLPDEWWMKCRPVAGW